MRAHEFLFEQSGTDQDAQQFLINMLASSYSLNMTELPMKSILKSLLDQGYLRDVRWVLNTIKQLPDDDNLIVNKDATDHTKVIFQTDEGENGDMEPAQAPDTTDATQTVDAMAKSALDRRLS